MLIISQVMKDILVSCELNEKDARSYLSKESVAMIHINNAISTLISSKATSSQISLFVNEVSGMCRHMIDLNIFPEDIYGVYDRMMISNKEIELDIKIDKHRHEYMFKEKRLEDKLSHSSNENKRLLSEIRELKSKLSGSDFIKNVFNKLKLI